MRKLVQRIFTILVLLVLFAHSAVALDATKEASGKGFVAQIDMDMLILPGTADFLKSSIKRAEQEGAKIIVVHLDTPGGMLESSQNMTQAIFDSAVPVAIFVSPSGSTATSAGVFITVSGHVAAMSPSTSIGAAHPVTGEGKDIEGDMREKASNMASAMVKSIAEERGRNSDWVVEAVKKSSSLTEKEALEKKVIDLIAEDQKALLKKLKGLKVKVRKEEVTLDDYSELPVRIYEPTFQQRTINFLANPNVAAILWLAATTGISIELYNPGLIFPGMIGVICLILALAVSQVIPVSYVGMALIACGALLFALELLVGTGILAVGGIISIILGMIYLFDTASDPYLQVSLSYIIPLAVGLGGFLLWALFELNKTAKNKIHTGVESLLTATSAKASSDFKVMTQGSEQYLLGRVFVNGESWKARAEMSDVGIKKGDPLEVLAYEDGNLKVSKKN